MGKDIRTELEEFSSILGMVLQETEEFDEDNFAIIFHKLSLSEMNKADVRESLENITKTFSPYYSVLVRESYIYITFAKTERKFRKCMRWLLEKENLGVDSHDGESEKLLRETKKSANMVYVVVFILLELPEPEVRVFSTRQQAIEHIETCQKLKGYKGFKPAPEENVFSFDDYFYQVLEKQIEGL